MKSILLVALLALGASARTFFNGCGGDLSGPDDTFTSPNHPNNYANNMDCTWTITIPDGEIVLNFAEFDVESSFSGCSYDKLTIRRANDNALLHTLCGTFSDREVLTETNSITLTFTSDSSVTKAGWRATWSKLSCASKGLQCVANEGACRGDVQSDLPCENGVCCQPPFEQGECGIVPAVPTLIGGKPRIVGGNEADHHEWPWQVSLRTTSSSFHFCGGSLINASWVVTAAHCVDGDTPSGLKVVTGEHDKGASSGREIDHPVSKIIMHEAYDGNGNGFPNDIALIKLTQPLRMDAYRRPICLPEANDEFLGSEHNCFITGWGNTQGTGDEDVLNELSVNVWEQATCRNTWGSSYINPGHICVGTGTKGACNGDSGGPLACQKTRGGATRWILAGATSWGRSGCQTAGYPSVYSRLSYFKSWILNKVATN